jgi:lysophospholipid acyltransferase
MLNGWNRSTHHWLKYYIFLRLVKKGERDKLTPIFCTMMVSAVWHGFYPGYFVFFVGAGFWDYIYKLAGKCYPLYSFLPDKVIFVIAL